MSFILGYPDAVNPSHRQKIWRYPTKVNAIVEIASSNLPTGVGGGAAPSAGGALGAVGFAAQFAAALEGLFGPTTASPAVPLSSGKGASANEAVNASIPSGPGVPRKNTSVNAASSTAVDLTAAAGAWVPTPQMMVAPSIAAASTRASGSSQGAAGQGLGTGGSGSATAATSVESDRAGMLPANGPVASGALFPVVSSALAGKDIGANAANTWSRISKSGFADAISKATPESIGTTPQDFDEAGGTSGESLAAKNSASVTQAASGIGGDEPAPGIQISMNATNLTASVVPQDAMPPGGVPEIQPVTFSSEALVAEAEPASAAAPSNGMDWIEASPQQQTSGKTSSLTPFFPAGISSITAGGAQQEESAGNLADQSAAPSGPAMGIPSAPAEVTGLSAAAMAAVVASAQSAAPTLAVPGSVSMRASKVSSSDSPSRVQSGGTVSSSGSSVAAAPSISKSSVAGSETPFSVFFPASAAAESVAAVFPKMMVPAAANASSHNNAQTSAGPAVAAVQSPSGNGGSPQSGAPQPAKSASSAHSEQNATATPPAGNNGSPTVTAPGTDSAQTSSGATASAAAQPSAGGQVPAIVVAQLTNPAAPADTAQKLGSFPAAPSNAANAATLPPAPTQPLPGPVQVAQMLSRAGQAEMRIGMNTSAFGSVEVRAVIHSSDVGLTIGSEKGDLRGLLTNEMPTISNSLEQQNLRLSNVSFMQGFASGGNMAGGGNAQQQQQRSFSPPTAYVSPNLETNSGLVHEAAELPPWHSLSFGVGSLSVLA